MMTLREHYLEAARLNWSFLISLWLVNNPMNWGTKIYVQFLYNVHMLGE